MLETGGPPTRIELEGIKPFAVVRLGFTETKVTNAYLQEKRVHFEDKWSAGVIAGIQPPSRSNLTSFAREYLACLGMATHLGVWGEEVLPEEIELRRRTKARSFSASYLDPISYPERFQESGSWIDYLEAKRVLIVHPFSQSIEFQHSRFQRIHSSFAVPDFEIVTLRPPVSQGLPSFRKNFFRNLLLFEQRLRDTVENSRPDVALVAAGAYGASAVRVLREEGVSALQLGGSLQLLFGIMGNRWRSQPAVISQMNSAWLDTPLERPPLAKRLIEGGSYW